MKTALVTGITGQTGSYMVELLLEKGYKVYGMKRRSSTSNLHRVEHIKDENFSVIHGELTDPSSINKLVGDYQPDELYNFAAQSFVGSSFDEPAHTFQVDTIGVLNCLEAIRNYSHKTKFYNAGSSEEFGDNYDGHLVKYQNENTRLSPVSPYGCAKVCARHLVETYRKSYGLFACQNWLFNHESPRRGEEFVTRKITRYIGVLNYWLKNVVKNDTLSNDEKHIFTTTERFSKLALGNLDAQRDWGFAGDYVKAIWLSLQLDEPDDFVICTGRTWTIRQFLERAFQEINIKNYTDFIYIDPLFYRPCEVEYLRGISTKASLTLDWRPKTSFNDLVKMMVKSDISLANNEIQNTN